MISMWLGEARGSWFGLAECGEELVATVAAGSGAEAGRWLEAALPRGEPRRLEAGLSPFAAATIAMLGAVESGEEDGKRFVLSPTLVPEPLRKVLLAASAIPLGYATSYGEIGRVTGAIARFVGRVMATNPLYPLVPCHRVVGSDLSLVGYRGHREGPDLGDKLARLRAEGRGYREELALPGAGGLRVFPVEEILVKIDGKKKDGQGQLSLWE